MLRFNSSDMYAGKQLSRHNTRASRNAIPSTDQPDYVPDIGQEFSFSYIIIIIIICWGAEKGWLKKVLIMMWTTVTQYCMFWWCIFHNGIMSALSQNERNTGILLYIIKQYRLFIQGEINNKISTSVNVLLNGGLFAAITAAIRSQLLSFQKCNWCVLIFIVYIVTKLLQTVLRIVAEVYRIYRKMY